MGLKEKVTEALRPALEYERIQLDDENGIIGYVVSSRFRGMTPIDRQILIEKILRDSPVRFTKAELRKILLIAAFTPAETENIDQEAIP